MYIYSKNICSFDYSARHESAIYFSFIIFILRVNLASFMTYLISWYDAYKFDTNFCSSHLTVLIVKN